MLDDLRTFLGGLPDLATMIQNQVHTHSSRATNTEEQRFHLEELQTNLYKQLKNDRAIYTVIYNAEVENTCPICRETFPGHYVELNNPATGKAIVSAARLMHAFIHHEQTFLDETMVNVTGTRVGEMRLALDIPSIVGTLKGGNVPPEAMADAEQATAIQQQQLVEAGTLVAAGGGH